MKKLIILIAVFPILFVNVVVMTLGYFFYTIWVGWFINLKVAWMQLWVGVPELVRVELPTFDSNGLLHNINYLNSINRTELIMQPLSELEKYVDINCYNHTRSKINPEDTQSQLEFYRKMYIDSPEVGSMFNSWNATDIGNLAYTAQHHPDNELRELCKKILEQAREHFNSFNQ